MKWPHYALPLLLLLTLASCDIEVRALPAAERSAPSPPTLSFSGNEEVESDEMTEYRRIAPLIAEIQSELYNAKKQIESDTERERLEADAEREIAEIFAKSSLSIARYGELSTLARERAFRESAPGDSVARKD